MTSASPTSTPGPVPDGDGLLRAVLAGVEAHSEQLIEVRRDLHAHPELSWAEERTSAVLADPTPAVPKAKASGSKAVVKGSGVNVRSAPSRGKSKVLFALAPGATVTISDNQRGWLKVTDAKGRSGWVYQEFVSRQ